MFPIKEIDRVAGSFPTTTEGMMPKYEDIPREFKNCNRPSKWNRLVSAMFFSGLKKLDLKPKPGVDKNKALCHIRYILGSWEPKHEHKEAGAAFLFNEWFEDVEYEVADRTEKV
jgi:hypothetical protein